MNAVRNFAGQINKTEGADETHLFSRLTSDPGKLDEVAALSRYLGERRDLRDGGIGIGCSRQLGRQKQLGNAHRLIDENLLLILIALAPIQNVLKGNDRGFELENRLEKQREFQRGNTFLARALRGHLHGWIPVQDLVLPNLNYGQRCHRPARIRVSQEPAQKSLFGLRYSGLAQKEDAHQGDQEHEPKGGSLHCGKSEEAKGPSDKWQCAPDQSLLFFLYPLPGREAALRRPRE